MTMRALWSSGRPFMVNKVPWQSRRCAAAAAAAKRPTRLPPRTCQVRGCTDARATTFHPSATVMDAALCAYYKLGCADPLALDFDEHATGAWNWKGNACPRE